MKLTNSGKSKLYKIYSFLIYLIPMTLLFIFNIDEYSNEGSVFGFWGIVVLIFVILAFKNTLLDFFKKRTLVSISLFVFALSLLNRFLSQEMLIISAVSLTASILSTFIEIVATVYDEHSFIVENGEKKKNKEPALPDKEAWAEAYGYNFIK